MKRPQGFERPPEPRGARTADPAAPVGLIERPSDESPPKKARQPETAGRAPSARARIRAAAKERRRYERAEVRRFTVGTRRRRRNWLIALGSLVAMIAIVAGVAFSPMMALRVVQVEGANRIPATAIVEALSSQLGTPLPLIDLDEVHEKLATFTLVQSYATESRPPDTLVVRIIERDPIGARPTATGFELVDSAGIVVTATPERPPGYPLLDTPSAKALAAAGEVVRSLPADIRAQLDTVKAATRDDVTLTLVSGTSVVWGSADDSALKATVFARLFGAAPGAGLYDVSAPANPVYR